MRAIHMGLAALVALTPCFCLAGLAEALQGTLEITAVQLRATTLPTLEIALPSAEGSVFIDAERSTIGQGVYRSGPTFTYEPETGNVTLAAPPMLGPADEFGQREYYSPNSFQVHAGDHLGGSPSIPQVTVYNRNLPGSGIILGPIPPRDEDLLSFVAESPGGSVWIDMTDDRFLIGGMNRNGFNGASVRLDRLLQPNLPRTLIASDDWGANASGFVQSGSVAQGDLPEVYFEVSYSLDYSSTSYDAPYSFQSIAILAPELVGVPEPPAAWLAFLGAVLCWRVRGRP